MLAPPDPEMRRAASAKATPKSQSSQASTADTNQSELDLQARKLCRRFLLTHDTARTIATLAYGVAR